MTVRRTRQPRTSAKYNLKIITIYFRMPVEGRLLHRGKKINHEDLEHKILDKEDFLKLKQAIVFGSNNYLPQSRDPLRDAWMVLASVLITTRSFNLQQSADALAKELSTVLFKRFQSPVQNAKGAVDKCSLLPGLVKISANIEDLIKLFENASFAYNHGRSAAQKGEEYTLMMLIDLEDLKLTEKNKPHYGVYQLESKVNQLTSTFYLNNDNVTIDEEEQVKMAINRLASMLCEVKQIKEDITSKKEDYKSLFERTKTGAEFVNSKAKLFQKGTLYTRITSTILSTDTEKGGLIVSILQIYLLGGKIFDPLRASKSALDLQEDTIHLEDIGDYLALLFATKQPFRLPCSLKKGKLEFENYAWPTPKEKGFSDPANSILATTKIPKLIRNTAVGNKEKNKKTAGIRTKNSATTDNLVVEKDDKIMEKARNAWNDLKKQIQEKEKRKRNEEREKEREKSHKKAKKEKKRTKDKEGKQRSEKKEKHGGEREKSRSETLQRSPVAGPSTK